MKKILLALPLFLAINVNAEVTTNKDIAEVYKSEYCGCCQGWIDYANQHGIETKTHNTLDLNVIKQDLNVPQEMASCHTIKYKDLVIEGHVPVQAIEKAIELRKTDENIYGVSVPGMPMDSPGMNGNTGKPYDVYLLIKNQSPKKIMTFKEKEVLKSY